VASTVVVLDGVDRDLHPLLRHLLLLVHHGHLREEQLGKRRAATGRGGEGQHRARLECSGVHTRRRHGDEAAWRHLRSRSYSFRAFSYVAVAASLSSPFACSIAWLLFSVARRLLQPAQQEEHCVDVVERVRGEGLS
jgi:hypothetical protein